MLFIYEVHSPCDADISLICYLAGVWNEEAACEVHGASRIVDSEEGVDTYVAAVFDRIELCAGSVEQHLCARKDAQVIDFVSIDASEILRLVDVVTGFDIYVKLVLNHVNPYAPVNGHVVEEEVLLLCSGTVCPIGISLYWSEGE